MPSVRPPLRLGRPGRDSTVLVGTGLGLVAFNAAHGGSAAAVVYAVVCGLFAATMVGTVVRRWRTIPRGWTWLAAAVVLFVAGDVYDDWLTVYLKVEVPDFSAEDVCYLAGYLCAFVAVITLTRSTRGRREHVLDAALSVSALLAVFWQVLLGRYADDASLPLVSRVLNIVYPTMDLGLLFVVALAVLRRRVHSRCGALLVGGLAVMAATDLAYDVLILHDAYTSGGAFDSGWVASYGLLAAATIAPTPLGLRGGMAEPGEDHTPKRLPILLVTVLVPPGLLVLGWHGGVHVDVLVLSLLCLVTCVLCALRAMWLLDRVHDQAQRLRARSAQLQRALEAQRDLQEELRRQAFHDVLTGLPNRALLHERLQEALQRAVRGPGLVGVLMCDLDGFKSINDSMGHDVGDLLLVEVARRLNAVVRPGDTVARLGGDEFAIVMPDLGDPAEAERIGQRVVATVREPVIAVGRRLRVSTSVGLAVGNATQDAAGLLSDADAAMYAVKAAGKDRVTRFEQDMRRDAVRRATLRSSFHDALVNGEFSVQYQPHADLARTRLVGFEALVRWRHPLLGTVPPSEFIPLAEETGFIVPLGRWVLEQACAAAVTWRAINPDLRVAVNMSARQLQNAQVVDDIRAALAISGLPPEGLILEVTETMLIADPAMAVRVLHELRALGLSIALDDFGTGYSSLNSLMQFPVDIVKIDKSFIRPLDEPGTESEAFVSTIIELARRLDLVTIAEGVETVSQHDMLLELGCQIGQGHWLAPPLAEHTALGLVLRTPLGDAALDGDPRAFARHVLG